MTRTRFNLAAFAMMCFAAAGALFVASIAVEIVENRSRDDVARILGLNGLDWAEVEADGLQIKLRGEAPDEAARFKAIRETGKIIDAARVIDEMDIEVKEPIQPPRFSVEILRNKDGISLIGLVPGVAGDTGIADRIREAAPQVRVTNLLDYAAYDAPENWDVALGYGIAALGLLERSKISITGDRVDIRAISDSISQKRDYERALRRDRPADVDVIIDIGAPRPVITPYTLRFVLDEQGARFDACSTDTPDGQGRILGAARAVGLEGPASCTLGLGVPSPEWDRAAELAIAAVGELGAGSVTFSDADVTFVGSPDNSREMFDRVTADLKAALPDAFSVFAILPEKPQAGESVDAGPPEFTATLSPEGEVRLRGAIANERTRAAAENFARAQFGADKVTDAMRIQDGLPVNWALRVFASLEALAQLENGIARAEPSIVEVSGNTGNEAAGAAVARILSGKLGETQEFKIDVIYVEALDPLAAIPTPQECVDQINAVLEAQKITFAPSSADINDEGRASIQKITDIMADCEYVPMEVAGHTDSQGREIMNKELSQARADAVVNALLARRVLTSNMRAVGYGEEFPIADNDTEEGREANRRIEFTLREVRRAGQETGEAEVSDGEAARPETTEDTNE